MKCKINFLPAITFLILIFFLSGFTQKLEAALIDITGWGWSSNIGWISFSSANENAGTGATYGVRMDTGSNPAPMSGYAWSPNVGWISFNAADVAGCSPAPCSPTVNTVTGDVTGWARVLSGVGRTDGWDGWIHLSGDKHQTGNANGSGGLTYIPSQKEFKGFAWGDLVGWTSFDLKGGVTPQPTLTATCNVTSTSLPSSGGTIQASVSGIANGTAPYSYEWSIGGTTFLSSVSTNPYRINYPANADDAADTYTPFVRITDSTSKRSSPISCGTVTVAAGTCTVNCGNNNSTTPEINLIVRSNYYPDISSETAGGIARVRADKPFTILAEAENMPAGTQCSASKDTSAGVTGWTGTQSVDQFVTGSSVVQQTRRVVYQISCQALVGETPVNVSASIPVIAVDPNSQQF